jgi:hypothetical protein
MWKWRAVRTRNAYYSMFDNILLIESESDNTLKRLNQIINFIPFLNQNHLRDHLETSSFKFKVVFLVLYHYHWLKTTYPERNRHVNLHDLRLFLRDQRLLSYEKLNHILEYSLLASSWLNITSEVMDPNLNEYWRLHKQIEDIQISTNIRKAFKRQCCTG